MSEPRYWNISIEGQEERSFRVPKTSEYHYTPAAPKANGDVRLPDNAWFSFLKVFTTHCKRDYPIIDRSILVKSAAAVWQRLDVEEKSEWSELAAKNQESHKLAFPGWKWQPNKRKRKEETPSVREIHYPPREDEVESKPPAAHGPSHFATSSPPSRLPSQSPAATPPAPATTSEHWEDEIASASRKLKMIPEPPWASASATSTSASEEAESED